MARGESPGAGGHSNLRLGPTGTGWNVAMAAQNDQHFRSLRACISEGSEMNRMAVSSNLLASGRLSIPCAFARPRATGGWSAAGSGGGAALPALCGQPGNEDLDDHRIGTYRSAGPARRVRRRASSARGRSGVARAGNTSAASIASDGGDRTPGSTARSTCSSRSISRHSKRSGPSSAVTALRASRFGSQHAQPGATNISRRIFIAVDVPFAVRQRAPAGWLPYSSLRRHQMPDSLRPFGARSSHWYMPQRPSSPRA